MSRLLRPSHPFRLRPSAGRRRAGAAGWLAALLLTAALAPCASAQATGGWWRAIYRGSGEDRNVVLDLTLDGTRASGRLLLPSEHAVLVASGNAADQGGVSLELREPDQRGGPDGGATAAAGGPQVGSLEGTRSQAPNDDGSRFSGRLTVDGRERTLSLVRVAQYVRTDVRDGPIHVLATVPHFFGPDLASLDPEVGPPEWATLTTFVREGRSARAAGGLFHAWELIDETRLEGIAGPYVSLMTTRYRYTGGAHGLQSFHPASYRVYDSGPARLTLEGLFAPGSDYLARLEPLLLADLRAQGALWVVQGQVTRLRAQDLDLFTLTPAGLSFTFPPYAMGPYVQGSFTVTVPYPKVLDLATTNGALQAFARAGR